MSFGYSGSENISRGIPKIFSDSTYYSFKINEFCRIGVDGNPLVTFKDGDEFVIKIGVTYIFDRDIKISLSYPDVDAVTPPVLEIIVSTDNDIYSSSGFSTLAIIPTYEELTDYTLFASVAYWKVTATTITMKVLVDAVELASVDVYCPTSQYTILAINESLTTTIPANSIIELQIENGGTNDTVVGSRVPTVLSIRENI